MSKITYVPVKVAPYPFTTLHPNLGFVQYRDGERVLVADVPGIIKNAHINKGLGISFLKHIERTSLIVYVIDVSGFEGRDPIEDYMVLKNELTEYNKDMLLKPFLVVLNKIDIEGADENIERFKKEVAINSSQIFTISAKERQGLDRLIDKLKKAATQKKIEKETPLIEEDDLVNDFVLV